MKRLLRLIGSTETKSEPTTSTTSPNSKKYPVSKTGRELLADNGRQRIVVLIKRSLSVTQEVWDAHYLYALERFAELVQDHPASRLHHHSQAGGLLNHTLDVTLRALRLSSGVILPPGSEPEELLHNAERWRYGIFICALLHDIGKVIGDQETVYKDLSGNFVHWQAWHGPIPVGSEYAYRYRKTRGEHIHGLHEKLGITLLPFLLTPSTSKWLTSDRKLLGQMMNTLSASATGVGVIGELIRKSDRGSTADNLGPDTGLQDSIEKPLHAKILEALQTLANEGKLKRNLPGASLWVTTEHTYIVAKSTMEKVREHLLASGHKSIPQSPLRLMQILNEHKVTIPPVDSGDSQQAVVNDEQRSWTQKLSFVVIPNETLWISGTPNTFAGTITPVDSKGEKVQLGEDCSTPEGSVTDPLFTKTAAESCTAVSALYDGADSTATDTSSEAAVAPSSSVLHVPKDEASTSTPSASTEQTLSVSNEDKTLDTGSSSSEVSNVPTRSKPVKVVSRTPKQKPAYKSKQGVKSSPLRAQSELFAWLLSGIKYRRIRVNESGAPVHIIEGKVALVSPKVFDLYLDDNKAKAVVYGKNRDRQLLQLQREVKSLNVHIKNNGEDFHKIAVRGPRKESTVSAFLLERSLFPELETLSENPILELMGSEEAP